MQIRTGSLLISHPTHALDQNQNCVVYVTESSALSTMGLVLNDLSDYNMREVMNLRNVDWPGQHEVYIGGDVYSSSLIMLHSNDWYSTNTMQIDGGMAITSDTLMIDKMSMGNEPDWYKLYVGCMSWTSAQLDKDLKGKKPKWLLLAKPSSDLLQRECDSQWDNSVLEYSQDLFNEYI